MGACLDMKTVAAHVLTALLTLIAAWLLFAGTARRPVAAQPGFLPPARPGVVPPVPQPITPPPAPVRVAPPGATIAPPPELDRDEQINIRVYVAVNKSVVNITSSTTEQGVFGEETSSGTGSGFVVDNQGHIVTNFHVVDGADAIQVRLHDGSTVDAHVVGVDPSNDVAVLRIAVPKAMVLTPLVLGDSTHLLVGQKVLAVGNPFGLERTLTTGIISALDRTMKSRNDRLIKGVIQTDAAINPGNSGGPLLNTRGEVIGLTTAIISRVSQSAGIGFAVPVNSMKRVVPQLITRGRVIRADIGIRRALQTDMGLLITDIVEGGPADRAGLQPLEVRYQRLDAFRVRRIIDVESADIIKAIDGKPVKSFAELLTEVETRPPGASVTLTVVRGGKTRNVAVVLGRS